MNMVESVDLIESEVQDKKLVQEKNTVQDNNKLTLKDRVPLGNDHNDQALQARRVWLKEKTETELDSLTQTNIDPKRLRGVVENFIGAVQIPVGLAGPLQINGEMADGMFLAPFATVEGAITLSASRGAKVINESGGIKVRVLDRKMTRTPLFQFNNVGECETFIQWVKQNYSTIEAECNRLSRHGMLDAIEEFIIGNTVHLQFSYSTGDAAGQNMVTIMTDNGTIWMRENFEAQTGIKIRFYSLEGNMSGDKKLNMLNYNANSSTRGAKVFTEVLLKKDVFERVFKCPVEDFMRLAELGSFGSVYSGTFGGLTINSVNVITAIYAATGQDIACAAESSSHMLTYELTSEGIYWSCTYNSIVTGTKSNAARLPTQKECIKLLDCDGPGGATKLAEIIAAFSVALDISTLASMANDTFSSAHRMFGRG